MNNNFVKTKQYTPDELKSRYYLFKQQNPDIRFRNAAKELGVSEGELLSSRVGEGVTCLRTDFESILRSVILLGEVMALTRNESCVHERKGVYDNCGFSKMGNMSMGMFVNPDIDLRLFMHHWKYCFAVIDKTSHGTNRSLQFFDKEGTAVHKIYLNNKKSNLEEYKKLVELYSSDTQDNFINIESYEVKKTNKPDAEIDWKEFRKSWENLQDTHHFNPMLRKYNVGREQAFSKIGNNFAFEVNNDSTRRVLELARDRECEIMVFVGNRGCIQIHTGYIKNLKYSGSWYNVLDPNFNLHLLESKISRTWVVRKPTKDGIVTSLEVFDENSNIIVTFFGKRKLGIPELKLWREIIDLIPAKY